MDAVGSASVNTNYGSYSDYASVADVSCETLSAEACAVPGDSSNVGSFGSGKGTGELSDLYSQKSQAESELGNITSQKNEAQTKVNARKQELTQNRQGGEEHAAENEAMGNVQELYAQTVSARDESQQALNRAQQESSANDQSINSNAQQRQSVSAQLSSAQSQLASLQAPAKSGGGDGEDSSDYEAEYSAYESQKSALEAQIAELQQKLQELQSESQQLQSIKAQLDRELNSRQSDVLQLDAALEVLQSELDEAYQAKAADDAGLENAFAMDGELKELQSELQSLQQQEAEKQAEVAEINERIAAAEANDEGLQTVREEAADQAFKEAAEQIGFDASGAETAARSTVAQEMYGKPYEELTEEEKLSIETRVDGEVTLEAMELARQKLEEDPDNAAAQAVIERGAKSLDAQAQLAQTRFNNSMENLPESMREGAAAAMAEARNNAAEGDDPEAAAMEALMQYFAENSGNADLGPEELDALDDIAGTACAYADAVKTANKGADIVDKAAESFAKSDLAAMKADLAAQRGVSPDQLIVLSGTDGNDEIEITKGENGGICVTIGDKVYSYTAEEAKYLIIDGGAGNDDIWADCEDDELMPDLHIFGGAGNDWISGGTGNDMLYGGAGNDEIWTKTGNNQIYGGDGDDELFGGDGNDVILGGAGNDYIAGGEGDDLIDGGDGNDELYAYSGNNIILGGAGNDYIIGGKDSDTIDGGDGNDELFGGDGNDAISGGDGNDKIEGGDGCDVIDGGDGDDTIYGESEDHGYTGYLSGFDDIIFGGDGDDTIDGGEGSDIILGEKGDDNIKGSYGDDLIDGGEGWDGITGHVDFDKNGYGQDCIIDDHHDFVYNGTRLEGTEGISREDIAALAASGALNGQSLADKLGFPEEGMDGLTVQEVIGIARNISDVYGKVVSPVKTPVDGAKSIAQGYKLYQAAKLPPSIIPTSAGAKFMASIGKFTGVAGGLISMYGGITDIIDGANNGDTAQIVSGSLQTVSGGLAVAAVFCTGPCPPAAGILWILSGAFALGGWIASWF